MRFTEWFRFEPIAAHQKVVLAEDFMEYLAPEHWPPDARAGFCWLPADSSQTDCNMKEGVLTSIVCCCVCNLLQLSCNYYSFMPWLSNLKFSHCESFIATHQKSTLIW